MHLPSAPAWSFKGKPKQQLEPQAPGPGAYEPKITSYSKYDSPPKCKIGTSQRDNFIQNDIPGPGSYNENEIRPHSIAPIIGSESRSGQSKNLESPGPGSYSLESKPQGPQFSMLGRSDSPIKNGNPGPGQYEPNNLSISRDKSPSFKIGSASRPDIIKNTQGPGPGSYEATKPQIGPKWGFGSDERSQYFINNSPGPGAYNIHSEQKSGFTMAKKFLENSIDYVPGPGAYDPSLRSKSPQWSMGREPKSQMTISNNVPGPGSYNIEDVKPHSLAPKMGSSEKSPQRTPEKAPGPGAYEIPNRAVEGPQFSIKGRDEKSNKDKLPGPGQYNLDIKDRSPAFSMGTSAKIDKGRILENPGPGAYDAKDKDTGPKWGFGSETKEKSLRAENPGPGTYELSGTLSKTAFSIGGRNLEAQKDINPGPGAYAQDLKTNSPMWSMGKQPRADISKTSDAPGPGTYTIEHIHQHLQSPVMGTSSRSLLNDLNSSPGPGTYEVPNRAIEGPQFTMKGKEQKISKDKMPGPGHYNQDISIKDKSPAYSIGTSPKIGNGKVSENPGPGSYDTRGKEIGPKWGFGSQKRGEELKIAVPGPGAYESPGFLSKGGFSLTGRKKDKNPENFPGPGSYESSRPRAKSPSWSMGKQSRSTKLFALSPGPGAYSLQNPNSHIISPVIGTSQRQFLNNTQKTPGPGAYDSKFAVGGPKYTIKGREEKRHISTSPGPGHYNQEVNDFSIKDRSPAYKIGLSARSDMKKIYENPGPGQYDTRSKISGPKWGFGSDGKSKYIKNDMPGPGAYESLTPKYNKGFSMTSRKHEKSLENYPGPGSYENRNRILSPSWSMGIQAKLKELEAYKNGVPGPGAYTESYVRPHSTAPIMGSAKKGMKNETGETPGPGAYDVKPKAMEGPKFTMQGKNLKEHIDKIPGPGHYDQDINNVNAKDRSPAYKLGTAARIEEKKLLQNPGPGQYDTRSKDLGPQWGFGSESRSKDFKAENPGPGAYELPGSLSKNGFSIAGRKQDITKDNFPGPGSYDIHDRPKSPTWTLSKSPNSKAINLSQSISPGPGAYDPKDSQNEGGPVFGTSNRSPLSKSQITPGPGAYIVGDKVSNSPSYTMSSKNFTKNTSNNPGPGQYDPKLYENNPKWSVGKGKKGFDYGLNKSSSLPGPGLYDVRKGPLGPHWGFGSSTREQNIKSDSPGPGQYELPSVISNLPAYATSKL
ncbi:hypothetical protein SteCoe_33427 [Stentor coeruleus]|uniref:Uncharacterized protein n=1 Tax=Stentor coeruleus TaxID=5963 RepID=A0A1R2AWR6_9CILI|nr:hypothetical protein SteCoe_33427 [Stentor coeruleus]